MGDEESAASVQEDAGGRKIVELTNVAVELLEPFEQTDRDGLVFVDSLGVIDHVKFDRLARDAARWADLLRARDVSARARVVVTAGDPSWRSTMLGVLEAGCVALPSAAPAPELRALATEMGAAAFAAERARPDLLELPGIQVLSADEFDSRRPPSRLRHMAMPGEAALVIDGDAYSHSSLLAQAEAAAQWLELREGERVWSTAAADGSIESIWLLLAAWRAGAEIVAVETSLDPIEQLELLHRFQPAVVWFSDAEYAALAATATAEPAWAKLGSIRRALASVEGTDAPAAFGHVFGVDIALASARPLPAVAEAAEAPPPVVDEREAAQAEKSSRKEQKRLEDERSREEKLARRREKEAAKERQQAEARRLREEEENRKRAEAAERAEREAAEAEERRLADEAQRAEREAAKAEEQRRRDEEKNRKLAERAAREAAAAAAVEERRRAEDAKRAEREAAKAEEKRRREEDQNRKLAEKAELAQREAAEAEARRLADEAKREREADDQRLREVPANPKLAKKAEREAAKAEEQRRREEEKNRKLAERAAAEERRRAEKAEREAAKAAEQRRAEDEKRAEEERRREARAAKELQKVEEQRLREEEKNRKLAARAEADERRRAEKAERAEHRAAERLRAEEAERERREVEAADVETARERRERIAHEARQLEPEIPPEAHAKSDRELDIVSRINQYGMGSQVEREREDDTGVLATVQPDEPAP